MKFYNMINLNYFFYDVKILIIHKSHYLSILHINKIFSINKTKNN